MAGAWAYDAHEDDGGEITLAYPPERVFNEAVYVAENRGEEVKRSDGAMRVHCKVDETEVVMQIFVVPGNEQVSRLKVTARSVLRGEPELAKDFGIDVQARLQGEGSWQTGR